MLSIQRITLKQVVIYFCSFIFLTGISFYSHSIALKSAIEKDFDYLNNLFHHFHKNPELSMQEFETSDRIAKEFQALGIKVIRNIGKTGLVGIIKNGEGPTVMIRADMDGLPILEKSGVMYASKKRQINLSGKEVPVSHACGHDIHITSLVGTARRLVTIKDEWRGTVILLAQPAEEKIGGASAMISDNLYERVGVPDYAMALHVDSTTPAGTIEFNDGFMFSSADTVKILIHGVGTHGAAPQYGKDPIVLASQIVLALQTIVTREISPLEPAIITVGSFHAGSAANIIPNKAELAITVRTNNDNTRNLILKSIQRVAENAGRMAGLPESKLPSVILPKEDSFTTDNNPKLAKIIRASLQKSMGKDVIRNYVQKDMHGEDFPVLVKGKHKIPSLYFIVGGTWQKDIDAAKKGLKQVPFHHSPFFRIEAEPSIKVGVEAMTHATLELLKL